MSASRTHGASEDIGLNMEQREFMVRGYQGSTGIQSSTLDSLPVRLGIFGFKKP